MKMTKAKRTRLIYNIVTFALVIAAFIILQSMIANKTISRSLKGQLVPICCWIVMAVSLNLVIGISGELSLGHAGFMSIGAYTGTVMSGWLLNAFDMQDPTLRLVLAVIAGGLLAGVAGVLIGIPVLRLRGDYLAIVTLAFGEIIRNLVNVLYVGTSDGALHFSFLSKSLPENVTMLVDGANAGGRGQGRCKNQAHIHLYRRVHSDHDHPGGGFEPGEFPHGPGHQGHAG